MKSMKAGSVTVDLAAATGGNIGTTRADEARAAKANRFVWEIAVVVLVDRRQRPNQEKNYTSFFVLVFVG